MLNFLPKGYIRFKLLSKKKSRIVNVSLFDTILIACIVAQSKDLEYGWGNDSSSSLSFSPPFSYYYPLETKRKQNSKSLKGLQNFCNTKEVGRERKKENMRKEKRDDG